MGRIILLRVDSRATIWSCRQVRRHSLTGTELGPKLSSPARAAPQDPLLFLAGCLAIDPFDLLHKKSEVPEARRQHEVIRPCSRWSSTRVQWEFGGRSWTLAASA